MLAFGIIVVVAISALLCFCVLKLAFWIIDIDKKTDMKRFNFLLDDYEFEKKYVALHVIAFFIFITAAFIYMVFNS